MVAKLIPTYLISKNTSFSLIYWNAYNLEQESINSINFLSSVLSISNISVSQKMYCSISPQLFYLNVDGEDGIFFSPIAAVGIKNFPLYLSSQVNTTIFTNLSSDPGFKWNVALNYNFSLTRWNFHLQDMLHWKHFQHENPYEEVRPHFGIRRIEENLKRLKDKRNATNSKVLRQGGRRTNSHLSATISSISSLPNTDEL